MIYLTFKWFTNKYGVKEYLLDYACDDNLNGVPLPSVSPKELGAINDPIYGWILPEKRMTLTKEMEQ